jgi:urease accessory protein
MMFSLTPRPRSRLLPPLALLALTHRAPCPLTDCHRGLAHPLPGLDHLFFLCALSLAGLRRWTPWLPGLLAAGLLGSVIGLVVPGLPLADAAVAFSLGPSIAPHGDVLGDSVIGWSQMPLVFYGLGLLLSQGTLLLAFTLLRSLADGLTPQRRAVMGAGLMGCRAAWTWSTRVA